MALNYELSKTLGAKPAQGEYNVEAAKANFEELRSSYYCHMQKPATIEELFQAKERLIDKALDLHVHISLEVEMKILLSHYVLRQENTHIKIEIDSELNYEKNPEFIKELDKMKNQWTQVKGLANYDFILNRSGDFGYYLSNNKIANIYSENKPTNEVNLKHGAEIIPDEIPRRKDYIPNHVSYHFIFSQQPDIENIYGAEAFEREIVSHVPHFDRIMELNYLAQLGKKYQKLFLAKEGRLKQAELKSSQNLAKKKEKEKYETLAKFFQEGGRCETFSTDFYFDGLKFKESKPFIGNNSGYIMSLNLSLKDYLWKTVPFSSNDKNKNQKLIQKNKAFLENSITSVTNLNHFFLALKPAENLVPFYHLQKLSLKDNHLTSNNLTHSFIEFLEDSHIEYLNLDGCFFDLHQFQVFPKSLETCHFLNKVDFNSISLTETCKSKQPIWCQEVYKCCCMWKFGFSFLQCQYCFKKPQIINGLKELFCCCYACPYKKLCSFSCGCCYEEKVYPKAHCISDKLGAEILQSLNGSRETLKEVSFDGLKKYKRDNSIENPEFPKGKLGLKSIEQIINILDSFPNIHRISFKNNRLPEKNIGNAISYSCAKAWITQMSFENNFEKEETKEEIKKMCCCCKVPKWALKEIYAKSYSSVGMNLIIKSNNQAMINEKGNKLLKKIATVKCMLSAYENATNKHLGDKIEKLKEAHEKKLKEEEEERKQKHLLEEKDFNQKLQLATAGANKTLNMMSNTAPIFGSPNQIVPVTDEEEHFGLEN